MQGRRPGASRMTRSTNMEHVEVLERLRGVLEHGKMGDKCLIAPDLVTAAIAALSAQQPPAEAQPVAKLVNRKDADGGKTTTFIRPTEFGMDLPLGEYPLHLHPPPSAPVGVEWPLSLLRAGHWREVYIGHRCMRLEVTYDYATWERLMAEVESAIAQQPAAAQPQPKRRPYNASGSLSEYGV